MTDPMPTPTDPTPTPAPVIEVPTTPPVDDKPLGVAGEKALAAEREAVKELKKKVAELEPLAALLGGKPTGDSKTDLEKITERLAEHEKTLAEERAARFRAEVAHEKGLTAAQVARLRGSTREELLADADELLALFPTAPAKPGIPAPDPSQGQGGSVPDLDTRIAEAQKAGDWRKVIALQNEKLNNK